MPTTRMMLLTLPLVVGLCTQAATAAAGPELTHGLSVGDVSTTEAIVWGRCSSAAVLDVVASRVGSRDNKVSGEAEATATSDFTARVRLTGLRPATAYDVSVTCRGDGATAENAGHATFRTAPRAHDSQPVSFIVGADLGGQGYCRLVDGGYRIFAPMTALKADFFIANGDMIYADNRCQAQGPEAGKAYVPGDFAGVSDAGVDWTIAAQLDAIYRDHWKYNRADANFQAFLASTPQYVQWDDHEVVNDMGGAWSRDPHQPMRAGYPLLVERGLKAFFDYHPILGPGAEPQRIYRSFRWGRDLELFLIDARSYRSRNDAIDERDADDRRTKTMLGDAQLTWLINAVRQSDATWKVISSDVPWSIPTGSDAHIYGADAYANGQPWSRSLQQRTGFEQELLYMLAEWDRANVKNLVVLATDVHYASQMRHRGDFDGDGDALTLHELISGPLSAIRRPAPAEVDDTLGPVVLYAEGNVFNFATMQVRRKEGAVRFFTDVRDETGEIRPGSALEIAPE
ncbi:MAG: alkaline phosphatase D family protein [Pseudomonadales bacterium]|nr:alkaline phosphatase D family protein [Pseudomonadales bacterium]MCP5184040.1 alkaline phosphatase D family protein [Pseudomonadales bacterium]